MRCVCVIGAAAVAFALQAPAQKFVPPVTLESNIVVRVDAAGSFPGSKNPTSPVLAGGRLILIDQAGSIYVRNGDGADLLLGPRDTPQGLKLAGVEHVVNVASDASGTTLYVMFIASDPPRGMPRGRSPRDQTDASYVLYSFAFDGTRLSSPRAITALPVRTDGHIGGGLVVLPDGAVLFAVGDNGDSYEDGRMYSQDPAVHLAKLVRIDPATGATTIAAVGVRCVQRLVVTGSGAQVVLSFVDPGGWVSEELNSIALADLSGPQPLNFGWGRRSDGPSREGTFLIDEVGNSTSRTSGPDPRFIDPVAEFGREGAPFVAVSGPVMSTSSFSSITAMFGDLVSGAVYAITGPLTSRRQPVYRVRLVDSTGRPITLKDLAGGVRPDPRFFNFADGTAGVLLEKTGALYRLTEQKGGS